MCVNPSNDTTMKSIYKVPETMINVSFEVVVHLLSIVKHLHSTANLLGDSVYVICVVVYCFFCVLIHVGNTACAKILINCFFFV